MEGDEDWVYKYVESVPGENDKMKDTTTRDKLLADREELYKAYENSTLEWIQSPQSAEIKARRNEIAAQLKQGYWVLDPYIRARSFYDRVGILQPGGKVDLYPTGPVAAVATEAVVEKAVGGAAAVPVPAAVNVAVMDDDID